MSSATDLTELGERFHGRLCAGNDPIVTAQIVETFLPYLIARLRRRFSLLPDDDLIANAATDALLDYLNNPTRFVVGRGSLPAWLAVCARNLLLDALKQQKKRSTREEAVELADLETVYHTEAEAEMALLVSSSDALTWRRLHEVLDDPLDMQLVGLMMEGVRETQPFAALLGVASAPLEQQRAIVKQHKDRLKKKLQRHYQRAE